MSLRGLTLLRSERSERIVALWTSAASALFFCNAVFEVVFKLGVPFESKSQLEEAPPTLREDTTIAVFGEASQPFFDSSAPGLSTGSTADEQLACNHSPTRVRCVTSKRNSNLRNSLSLPICCFKSKVWHKRPYSASLYSMAARP